MQRGSIPERLWGVVAGITIAFLLVSVASAQGDAAEPDLSRPLTLEDCIELGLQRASQMRTAAIDVQSLELDVSDASAAYLPSIRTDGRYLANDRTELEFKKENFDLNVSAEYLIWDQGRRKISLEQARRRRDASEARFNRSRQDLILSIVRAYYRLLEAKTLVEFDKEQLELSRATADQVRAFESAGKSIPADVAAAEVRVAGDELNLVTDQNGLDIARANLPTTLGLDPETPIEVADDPGFEIYRQTGQIPAYAKTLDETIALALKQRLEIKESALNLRFLELARKRASLDRLPRLTARVDYGVNLDDYLRDRENFKDFRSWDATAALTFPLFDGGVARRAVDRAELALERAREQHAALRRSIALEAKQAYLNLKGAEKRLEISAVQVRNAKLNQDVTQERFAQGLAILLELLDASTQFGQARANQIRAYYDFKIAQRELSRALGNTNP